MEELHEILKSEIQAFRELGQRFLNKEITVNEYKGKSGGMGVYAQRGGEQFMIRLRTPSGVLSFDHLSLIHSYLKKYNLKQMHLTTRQAIQLHDLTNEEVCDIMEDAINHSLFTRGGGGNFPRNVSLSPLSGVEKGEAFDVTPYALLVGNYFLNQITSYLLPRKLKVAFSSSSKDTACSTVNDLGFLATLVDGKPKFLLSLAGGLGKDPAVSIPFGTPIDPEDVLYHVEAMTNLFISEGNYENKNQARTRYIPRRMGTEAFLECYQTHLEKAKKEKKLESLSPVLSPETNTSTESDTPCLISQKQEGYYTAVIHPLCGQMDTNCVEILVSFLKDITDVSIRLGMDEAMYIRNLTFDQASKLLELTESYRENSYLFQSISCIGVPTCQMGIAQSQNLVRSIIKKAKEQNIPLSAIPSLHVSGCPNSCARHQIAEIGFCGRKQRIDNKSVDVFELHTGGITTESLTKLGTCHGNIEMIKIPDFICDLSIALEQSGLSFQDFNDTETFTQLVNNYVIA